MESEKDLASKSVLDLVGVFWFEIMPSNSFKIVSFLEIG